MFEVPVYDFDKFRFSYLDVKIIVPMSKFKRKNI